jgi:hypothetical protein
MPLSVADQWHHSWTQYPAAACIKTFGEQGALGSAMVMIVQFARDMNLQFKIDYSGSLLQIYSITFRYNGWVGAGRDQDFCVAARTAALAILDAGLRPREAAVTLIEVPKCDGEASVAKEVIP